MALGFDPAPREVLKRQFEELQTTMQNGTCPDHHNAVAIETVGVDVYNHEETGEVAATFGRNSGEANTAGPKVAMAIRTANTHANGCGVAVEAFASPQDRDIDRGHMTECAPILAKDGRGVHSQMATEGKLIPVMEGETYSIDQGGGKSSCNVHKEVSPTTTTTHQGEPVVNQYHYAVRRITPTEGCRLQGFSDGWTRPCFTPDQITDALVDRFVAIHLAWARINAPDGAKAKPKSREWVRKWLATISSSECPDGPRYKAIGNSMSVNVMNWIGQRIAKANREEV